MQMTLLPHEQFEHAHENDSVTILVDGCVDLLIGGDRVRLVVGVHTAIPAKTSHTLINVGDAPATIECLHRDEPSTAVATP